MNKSDEQPSDANEMYRGPIEEQLRRIKAGTAVSSLFDRSPVPAGQEGGIGRDFMLVTIEGVEHMIIPSSRAEAQGINIAGALQLVDSLGARPIRLVLVPSMPYLMDEAPAPIPAGNPETMDTWFAHQERYILVA